MTDTLMNEDQQHLQWLYDRLRVVYGENKNIDYMRKFQSIIDDLGVPVPEVEGTYPVVIYLGSEADRDEIIKVFREIKPRCGA